MKSVPTCIVGCNNLFREGLKSLLTGSEYRVVALCERLADLAETAPPRPAPKLFLVGLDASDDHELASIRTARARYADSRIVVLTTGPSSGQFANCVAAGVDGYLGADLARQVLFKSLRVVVQGVQVFPTMFVTDMLAGAAERERPSDAVALPPAAEHRRLSPREEEILALLVEGASNKAIGSRLQIEDSTVKVHLRKIMKKVSAANRTQAAVWAASRGMKTAPAAAVVRRDIEQMCATRIAPKPAELGPPERAMQMEEMHR
jgi:two-component system nitrate/nitrite response regulator NarL